MYKKYPIERENSSPVGCSCRSVCTVEVRDTASGLEAYANPPQLAAEGSELVFDRNSVICGDAVEHEENSSTFVLGEEGLYLVSFYGSFLPAAGACLPQNLLLSLLAGGEETAGAVVQQSFELSGEVESVSFTRLVRVETAPVELAVRASGGNFFYTNVSLAIVRLGGCGDVE